jgi:hypothetical protein
MSSNLPESPVKAAPWWKFGYVWLVVLGPSVVVVASFITLYLAVTRPDPVTDENYYQKGMALNKTMGANASNMAPAEQGRNHAATGAPKPVDTP